MEFLRPNELNTYENYRMLMVVLGKKQLFLPLDLFGIAYELLMA